MKNRLADSASNQLAGEIAGLSSLSVKHLKEHWRSLYSTEPPPRISRELLTRALAYRLQERALGGLKPSTHRLLERISKSPTSRFCAHHPGSEDRPRNGTDPRMAREQAPGHRTR